MATDASNTISDIELLYQYLGKRLANGGRDVSLDRLMQEFTEYRSQLERVRALVQEGLDSNARGESKPLDLDALFARVDKRLRDQGIAD